MITLIAAAVALPPVAGGVAMAAPEAAAAHSDCCPPGELCEGHKPKDCGQTGACLLKCFNLSGGVIALSELAPSVAAPEHAGLAAARLAAASEHPPLPPPRL